MSIEAMKRIKSLLQDTKMIDSHTISAVVAECDMAILAQQPAQAVNEKHFGDFELLVVTTAYEQGFGHAFRTELSNPYAPATNACKAWDMGRSAGKRNGQPQQPATPVPMTDDEATAMIRETVRGNAIRREGSTSLQIVRATEDYYGITAQAKEDTP